MDRADFLADSDVIPLCSRFYLNVSMSQEFIVEKLCKSKM